LNSAGGSAATGFDFLDTGFLSDAFFPALFFPTTFIGPAFFAAPLGLEMNAVSGQRLYGRQTARPAGFSVMCFSRRRNERRSRYVGVKN
jgi:hypothetical protein